MEALRVHNPLIVNCFSGTTNQWVELAGSKEAPINHWRARRSDAHGAANEMGWMYWYNCADASALKAILSAPAFPRAVNFMQENRAIVPPMPMQRRKMQWRDSGDVLDRNRLYGGDINCWQVARRAPSLAFPLITLLVSCAINFNEHADTLFHRGVAAMNFVDAAEASGYRVQVISVNSYRGTLTQPLNGSQDITQLVTIKEHNEPLNINTLSVVIAFAGFLRYVTFRSLASLPIKLTEGLGYATHIDLSSQYSNCFVLSDVSSKREADKWLADTLAKVQVINDVGRAA